MFGNATLYPTPNNLIDKMLSKVQLEQHRHILEPSAGKANIVDVIRKRTNHSRYGKPVIDVIEYDPLLQSILKDRGDCNLIHDDFLSFSTQKRYSLILMNPPFNQDEGCKHLLKAIDLQKRGGEIVCILNAETVKNPYSNNRIKLAKLLDKYDTDIEFIENAFSDSERSTDVEIALIYVNIPKNYKNNLILDNLKNEIRTRQIESSQEIVSNDPMEQAIQRFNFEMEAGLNLIYNYYSLVPVMQNKLKEDSYSNPILEMNIRGSQRGSTSQDIINQYVEEVRYKFWSGLIDMGTFRQLLTTNLIEQFNDKLEELRQYDFTEFNIKQVMADLEIQLQVSVEDTIYGLFQDFTCKYNYDEYSSNVHLFDGWKTNKSWKINDKKIVYPRLNGFDSYDGSFQPFYGVEGIIRDIEKSLNYLDGGRTESTDDIRDILKEAKDNQQSKKVEFKYFYIDFYKKGTGHIIWKDKELIKKLNIFGSKREGALPPGYGNKDYQTMTQAEKNVVDSFEGEKSYAETVKNKSFYLSSVSNILALGEGA